MSKSITLNYYGIVLKHNHVKNLKKLARYLASLPKNYTHFDMGDFKSVDNDYIEVYNKSQFNYAVNFDVNNCGTAACACGHGPSAGIRPNRNDKNWFDYSLSKFGVEWSSDLFEYLFSASWASHDNTPLGAAKRIVKLLKTKTIPVYYSRWEEEKKRYRRITRKEIMEFTAK